VVGYERFDPPSQNLKRDQPRRIRREHRGVNRNCEVFAVFDITDTTQLILPTLNNRSRIEWRDIKLDSRSREIDTHPVDSAAPEV
jgi:hypothetical protein